MSVVGNTCFMFAWAPVGPTLPNDEIIQLVVSLSNDFGHVTAVVMMGERLESRSGKLVQLCLWRKGDTSVMISIWIAEKIETHRGWRRSATYIPKRCIVSNLAISYRRHRATVA